MGFIRVLLVIGIIYFLFRPSTNLSFDIPDNDEQTNDTTERRMLAFLLVGAGIWATDFVHGFHPMIGAVVVVVLVFLPKIGAADFETVSSDINFLGHRSAGIDSRDDFVLSRNDSLPTPDTV